MEESLNCIFFTEKAIRDFCTHFGKEVWSQDYEFDVAILLNSFFEKIFGSSCSIGFKIPDKYLKDIPTDGITTLQKVAEILRIKIDKDTLVDFIIARGLPPNINRESFMSFQVKKWKGDTVHLIAYLNGLDRKFSKTAETLIIVFETINTEVHLEKIQTEIKEKRFPFKEIMLISANLLSQKIFICGAWPKIWRREVSFH